MHKGRNGQEEQLRHAKSNSLVMWQLDIVYCSIFTCHVQKKNCFSAAQRPLLMRSSKEQLVCFHWGELVQNFGKKCWLLNTTYYCGLLSACNKFGTWLQELFNTRRNIICSMQEYKFILLYKVIFVWHLNRFMIDLVSSSNKVSWVKVMSQNVGVSSNKIGLAKLDISAECHLRMF